MSRCGFLVYHNPYSILAAVSSYVFTGLDSTLLDKDVNHYDFQSFYKTQFYRLRSVGYQGRRSDNDELPVVGDTFIKMSDVHHLTSTYGASPTGLYWSFHQDLTIIGEVLDRTKCCCAPQLGYQYGQFRVNVVMERLQSIIDLLEWVVQKLTIVALSPRDELWSLCVPMGLASTERWEALASRYGERSFEALLAWAYAIQLMQPSVHRDGRQFCMVVETKACRRPLTPFHPRWYMHSHLYALGYPYAEEATAWEGRGQGWDYESLSRDGVFRIWQILLESTRRIRNVQVINKYTVYGEELDVILQQVRFFKDQDISNEQSWQCLLEYLTVYTTDLRLYDAELLMDIEEYIPLYYPSEAYQRDHLIPAIFQKPLHSFKQTLAMRPIHNQQLEPEESYYNPWHLINVPLMIGDTIHTGCTLYMMGVYIVSTIDQLQPLPRPFFIPTEHDQRNIWVLLNKLFIFHARHELHPKELLVALYLVRF